MPNDSHRPDVAVFIDFENVYVSVRDKLDANPNFEMIMDRCEDLGRVVIARAYADWYRYPRVTSALYANGIEPMYVPTYYYDREMGRTGRAIKNSVDMNLCIDAMKTLFTNTNIAKFVLATGDRDFIPLVNSIRQQGKEVIVIGIGGAASAHLAQSADEFIFYEQLVGKKPTELEQDQPRAKMPVKGREYDAPEEDEPPPRNRERERSRETPRAEPPRAEPPRAEEPAQADIYDTLVSAINLARERGYVCSFGSLKLLMKELMGGDFKEGKYKDASGRPFAKFKDFVLEAERRGKVQVFTSGTVNEVFLPGEDPYKLSQFAGDIKEDTSTSIIPLPEIEERVEPRGASTNGRRRRRRARGTPRSAAPQDGTLPLDELADDSAEDELAEDELAEESEYTAPDEFELPELADETPLEQPDAQEQRDAQSEAVFEELRERVEEEAAEVEPIAALAPPEFLAEFTSPENAEVAGESAPAPRPESEPVEPAADQGAAATSEPFTEQEWQLLREVVERFERPAPFQQIHDQLRDARNNAGIARTNEELRSLIKQAINTGMLERIGKGNRASYQLAQLDEPAPDQASQIAPTLDEPAEPVFHTPAAAAEAAQAEAAAPAEDAPAPAKRPRRKPAAPAEPAAPSAPARSSRKKAAPAAPVEAQPIEAPTEAPAKPKRVRRKKTEVEA